MPRTTKVRFTEKRERWLECPSVKSRFQDDGEFESFFQGWQGQELVISLDMTGKAVEQDGNTASLCPAFKWYFPEQSAWVCEHMVDVD